MKVTFKTETDDNAGEQIIDVSPDSNLGESREAVQTLFSLPENPPYKLVLERTEEELKDNLTFEEAGIQDNDQLILSPSTDKKKPPPDPIPAPTPSSSPPPPPSSLDWRTAVIIGGVIGVFTLVGLVLSNTQNQQSDQVIVREPTSTPSPTSPVSPKPRPVTPPAPSQPPQEPTISWQKAVNLIQKYLEAKKVMFAPPYNRKILAEIGTSEFYEKRIGTINWLQERGAYYVYREPNISVEEFISRGNEAKIKVKVTEDYTLHNSDGSVDRSSSNFETLTVIYNMRLVNGNLKIYASRKIE